ncbi:glucan 1,3-beta-glucosidase [Exophiala viscosa]|uniref:glucan 1,3-beta-glucosidase n=1 Tax=Exophiala viscosa TaxID=2486360 RepID=UPI002191153F|nr:glucan 1,3-beta-glucosidase [Exophiala viscosa]
MWFSYTALVLYAASLIASSTAQSTYWLANKPDVGTVAFQPDTTYPVFRNVKDYGAFGDGIHDDSDAINAAIAYGDRCGGGDSINGSYCQSQTITPALVYFPPGTYNISKPLVMYYFTQMVGDAVKPPTIAVNSNFTNIVGLAVMDADIYIPSGSGSEWYANQNNFYRQIRNFIIDMTQAPLNTAGIHWQVAQATSLQNIVINMADQDVVNNAQQGIYMENGSGGFFSDVTIKGGYLGMYLGNQQFTTRSLSFDGCATAIKMNFDWLWTFTQLNIQNSGVGIDMTNGGFSNQATGSVVVLDSIISATQGIITPYAAGYSSPQAAGTLVLENVDFTGSQSAIAAAGGTQARVILDGGQFIALYAQGNAWTTAGQALDGQSFNGTSCVYANSSQTAYTAQETTIQRQLAPVPRPSNLVDPSTGQYIVRSKPQYETLSWATDFISAKAYGLAGDGNTDDTVKMQALFNEAGSTGQVVYFDKGAYVVNSTVFVPKDLKITGECLPIIMATGSFFGDQSNPVPVWQVGNPGDSGSVEMSDLVFEVKGPCPGAIVVQWNIAAVSGGYAGMWDVHWRIGGSAGTDLQMDRCIKSTATVASGSPYLTNCVGAFLLLHVTPQANGYFENIWGWVADHELDMGTRDQVTIFNKGGFLSESQEGPVWLYGSAFEHSAMFNYEFVNSSNVFMGHIQQETAYYQGNPNSLNTNFYPNASWNDPTWADCASSATNCPRTWGLRLINSSSIFMYGGGLYNFFENWNTAACLGTESCQQRMVEIENCTDIYLWALSTKGSQFMIDYMGSDVVPYSVNKANFCETIALFELAESP